MSERVERRLAGLLDHPHFDPYGNPIPGLDEIGEERTPVGFLDGVESLVAVAAAAAGPTTGVVARLGEPIQTDVDLLARLAQAGVRPGQQVTVEKGVGVVTVGAPGAETVLDLPQEVARHVFLGVG